VKLHFSSLFTFIQSLLHSFILGHCNSVREGLNPLVLQESFLHPTLGRREARAWSLGVMPPLQEQNGVFRRVGPCSSVVPIYETQGSQRRSWWLPAHPNARLQVHPPIGTCGSLLKTKLLPGGCRCKAAYTCSRFCAYC